MPAPPTSRMALRSSPSPSVRTHDPINSPAKVHDSVANGHVELELDEEGTRISLTVVDTPGFGDQIDNEAR